MWASRGKTDGGLVVIHYIYARTYFNIKANAILLGMAGYCAVSADGLFRAVRLAIPSIEGNNEVAMEGESGIPDIATHTICD